MLLNCSRRGLVQTANTFSLVTAAAQAITEIIGAGTAVVADSDHCILNVHCQTRRLAPISGTTRGQHSRKLSSEAGNFPFMYPGGV